MKNITFLRLAVYVLGWPLFFCTPFVVSLVLSYAFLTKFNLFIPILLLVSLVSAPLVLYAVLLIVKRYKVAKSFARIFYRNAINIGLLAIECDTDKIDAGDELELHIEEGILKNSCKKYIAG